MGTLQIVATGTVRSAARSRRRSGVTPEALVLASIVGLTGILRFMLLGHNSVWYDESFVVWVARHRWGDLLGLLQATEFHPPLHYLLMKAWIAVAGPREAAIRAPSAVATLMPYTHYLGFTVVAAHGVWVAACERKRLLVWCTAAIVVAVLFVPWLPYWAGQLPHLRSAPVWGRDSMDRNVLGLLGLFAFGGVDISHAGVLLQQLATQRPEGWSRFCCRFSLSLGWGSLSAPRSVAPSP